MGGTVVGGAVVGGAVVGGTVVGVTGAVVVVVDDGAWLKVVEVEPETVLVGGALMPVP